MWPALSKNVLVLVIQKIRLEDLPNIRSVQEGRAATGGAITIHDRRKKPCDAGFVRQDSHHVRHSSVLHAGLLPNPAIKR
jgi:hypothetical protein